MEKRVQQLTFALSPSHPTQMPTAVAMIWRRAKALAPARAAARAMPTMWEMARHAVLSTIALKKAQCVICRQRALPVIQFKVKHSRSSKLARATMVIPVLAKAACQSTRATMLHCMVATLMQCASTLALESINVFASKATQETVRHNARPSTTANTQTAVAILLPHAT